MGTTDTFSFLGGHAALDFMNTLDWRLSEDPNERIQSFAELVAFARQAELIDAGERKALAARAARDPARAEEALRRALELRELGYRLVEAVLDGKSPRGADLRLLNQLEARCADKVDWEDGGYVWHVGGRAGDPERLLHLLVRAVTEFLTSPECRHVGQCQDDRGCGWVFVDRSRARVRRWCSMADCGNRAKARRHYQRNAES